MAILKVKDKSSLVRDSETGAIINVNIAERENAITRRNVLKRRNEQIKQTVENVDELSKRVDSIEHKLDSILELLRFGKSS